MKGLEGIKVIDLTSYVAAPASPRILGEMGATVYKIEPATGDEYRTNAPGFGMKKTDIDDPSFDFASMNKIFVSINLKSEEGHELIEKMLADADILITSFRDKALVKLGLDWESVHKRHPHLVWAQMRGYGEYGPDKNTKGFDATAYAARGGWFACLPQAGEHYQPINWPAAMGDWNASLALTAGVLAALARKDRTGEGDKVTVTLHHAALWPMQMMLGGTQFGDKWPKSRYNVTCPTNNTYQTKDGVWFIICYGSYDIFYDHTMRTIGLDDMVGNERYNKNAEINDGSGRNEEVVRIMEKQFLTKTWAEWEPIFKANEIPYEKLYLPEDILADEEVYASDILRKVHYDAFGEKAIPTSPIRLDSMGDPVLHKSRPIGYDTAEVMHEYGYSDEDIQRMDGESVTCYHGPDLPDSVFEPSYGPRSKRD